MAATLGNNKALSHQDGQTETDREEQIASSADCQNSVQEGLTRNYHSAVNELKSDRTRLWICLVLAHLRGPVSRSDLMSMLPEGFQDRYHLAMSEIRPLIRGREKIEIADRNFGEYLMTQFPEYKLACNQQIITFCENDPDSRYAIANIVYHYSLSHKPLEAVIKCTQEWVDRLAHQHAAPDTIIFDIKRAAQLAAAHQQTSQLIRLVLLLQRTTFRYRTILTEFAAEMAQALIASKKYAEAITCLVQQNTLLTDPAEALHFLPYFYANEAWAEAELLHHALEKQQPATWYPSRKAGFIRALPEVCRPVSSDDESLGTKRNHTPPEQKIWDCGVALQTPHLLSYQDMNAGIHEIEKNSGTENGCQLAGMYAHSLVTFRQVFGSYNLPTFNTARTEAKVQRTIEYLVKHYGCPPEQGDLKAIIQALLRNPASSQLLRELMKTYLQVETGNSFRSHNGVDFDEVQFEDLCLRSVYRGFLDGVDDMKVAPKRWLQKTWEEDLVQLTEEIHFFEGKVLRYKTAGQLSEKSGFIRKGLGRIIESFQFSFSARMHWERSYQLPEDVCPLLSRKLAFLLGEYDHGRLTHFLETIQAGSADQVGLYSEGFRKTLREVVRVLIVLKYEKKWLLQLMQTWESHVVAGVENRWERTEELFLITEIYGIIREEKKVYSAYQEMLNTSMGPVWNQESPLKMVIWALGNLAAPPSGVLAEFATFLDAAAGEMTLPNEVKLIKEELIGSMIRNGDIQRALDYYKFEVIPTPDVVIRNAERSSFDTPVRGAGHSLGARNINEARAVLEILKTLECSPYLKWGLCQLFTVNEEMSLYVGAYSIQLAEALNAIESLNDGHIETVCGITAQLIKCERISREHQRTLAKQVGGGLSPSNRKRLQHYLDPGSTGPFSGNILTAVEKSPEGGRKALSSSKDLYAKKHITKPKALTGEDEKASLAHIKEMISSFDGGSAEMFALLKKILESKADDTPLPELYPVIVDHLHHVIRPGIEQNKKYSWLNQSVADNQADQLTAEFIIWHLNHPDVYLSARCEDTLSKLAVFLPSVIGDLLRECTLNRPRHSSEICSTILYEVSKTEPLVLGDYLDGQPQLIKEAGRIPHLSIKKNLLETGINLQRVGYGKLLLAVKESLPDSVRYIDEKVSLDPSLAYVREVVEELNAEGFLDQKFSLTMNELLEEYCFPMDKNNLIRSDWYLRRSFYKDHWVTGSYDCLVKHALNNAVAHRVTNENISVIYEIVNE